MNNKNRIVSVIFKYTVNVALWTAYMSALSRSCNMNAHRTTQLVNTLISYDHKWWCRTNRKCQYWVTRNNIYNRLQAVHYYVRLCILKYVLVAYIICAFSSTPSCGVRVVQITFYRVSRPRCFFEKLYKTVFQLCEYSSFFLSCKYFSIIVLLLSYL